MTAYNYAMGEPINLSDASGYLSCSFFDKKNLCGKAARWFFGTRAGQKVAKWAYVTWQYGAACGLAVGWGYGRLIQTDSLGRLRDPRGHALFAGGMCVTGMGLWGLFGERFPLELFGKKN